MSVEETKPVEASTVTVVDPETTIFVGNVARDCSEEDLKKVFEGEFGSVEVEIPSKTKDGRTFYNRYAFVKFPQKIDVEAIKQKYDKQVVKDKGIYIRKALTQEERDAERQERMRNRRGNGRGGRAGAKFTNNRGAAVPAPPRKDKTPLEEMERSNDTLYVNNIPYSATKEELAEFFGTKPELVVLPMRRMKDTKTQRVFFSKKMNRGIAFITFENLTGTQDINKMVEEFQGKTLQERPIVVDVAALRAPREEPGEAAPTEEAAQTPTQD
ncbi:hypothetical protein HG536_0A01820 [Torulaspora globosa]|uniref:RRM domain-containing protein n=1 Tax=Torulaspora globosa TaxID=48254 RepID=A0A7G3ZA29_9SACH|nr:uncharacterized protein HG536_0A01820 [Torulaspora globosa]QLL30365.1 hypothetical protein HG536_0A01820 [Torulaspora globosa]